MFSRSDSNIGFVLTGSLPFASATEVARVRSGAEGLMIATRSPRDSPLFRLVDAFYDDVKGHWEEHFERRYGFWRGSVEDAVYAFLDCGIFERGFARVSCTECRGEYLVAFSCQRRGFCPSCAAKRGALLGVFLAEEVVGEVGHCLWTFYLARSTCARDLRSAVQMRSRELANPLSLHGETPSVHSLPCRITTRDSLPAGGSGLSNGGDHPLALTRREACGPGAGGGACRSEPLEKPDVAALGIGAIEQDPVTVP
ncbi:MAG TPA: transposase zinc-binding domain-containing protein [Thermoanaerobaculia bacterium]|nr:transposase zinc-binding domain-containing protein [Thermoanaerobaculia bacterium]